MSLTSLLETLTTAEQHAVKLLQLSIASYNTRDGLGLFEGPMRYAVLSERARLAAVKISGTGSIPRFWSELLTSMRWPTPPKRVDALLLPLLESPEPIAVLSALADNMPSLITIARALNDEDRATKKALIELEAEELGEIPGLPLNPDQEALL